MFYLSPLHPPQKYDDGGTSFSYLYAIIMNTLAIVYLHRTSAVYTFEGRRRFDLHLVILISTTELNQVLVDARAILDEVCCRCALRQRVIKQQLLLAVLLLTSTAFLLRIRLRDLKDVLLCSLLRIVTFKTLTQNSLLLVTVKKD